MRKILTALLIAAATLTAHAQFEQGTKYIGVYNTGLGMTYNSGEGLRFGLGAEAGCFLFNNLMAKANVAYDHRPHADDISAGLGMRYYFQSNGIFLGTGAEYVHHAPNFNDLLIPVEVGYAFFINRYLTVQPSLYNQISINNFSHGTTFGLKIALGFYFK